jgi:hypothetical protein
LNAAQHALGVFGFIGLALIGQGSDDVPGMTCAEIGEFARHVAEHKATGATLPDTLSRLHQAAESEQVDRARALEKIIKAIYRIEIFSTATPEQVGTLTSLHVRWAEPPQT